MTTITHDLRDTLTPKEKQIYELLCCNMTNARIAERLDMPAGTLDWNLKNIYRKLGVERQPTETDAQQARRRAILYSGTKIEQTVTYEKRGEVAYSIRQIRTAAKKIGCSLTEIENLISFLEMEN